jgi:hypothetical protein
MFARSGGFLVAIFARDEFASVFFLFFLVLCIQWFLKVAGKEYGTTERTKCAKRNTKKTQ